MATVSSEQCTELHLGNGRSTRLDVPEVRRAEVGDEAVTNAVNACRRSGCSAPVTLYAEYR
ncbi:hypothetical protein ACFT8W_23285 [Streptomyces hygroscopicus]|uniref:hypothetical protein n=1 Tax=Streptomyces hygroscopicus TaxID=1912 RepID=UPI003632EC6F